MTVKVYGKLHLLNAEFARRLLAYAEDVGVSLHVYSGHRSFEEQAHLYDLYLRGIGNPAAPPGRSFHNHHGAGDTRHADGVRPGDHAARRRAVVRNGLVLAVPGEPWHLQPAGFSKARCAAGPFIQGNADLTSGPSRETITTVQRQLAALGYVIADDGVWGPKSREAMTALRMRYNDHNSPKIPTIGRIDADSTRAIAWAYANPMEGSNVPIISPPSPTPPPPPRMAQAVVTTDSPFDAPLGRALANQYNWAHIILPRPHDIGHAIVIGAAARSALKADGRTVLAGPTRVETAQAVMQFMADLPPGTEARRGDPSGTQVTEPIDSPE